MRLTVWMKVACLIICLTGCQAVKSSTPSNAEEMVSATSTPVESVRELNSRENDSVKTFTGCEQKLVTYLTGNISGATDKYLSVAAGGLEYRVLLTAETILLTANPSHPFPIDANIIVAGHFDDSRREGTAQQVWVDFVYVNGFVTQVFTDTPDVVFVVRDELTKQSMNIRLAHHPSAPALIAFHGERIFEPNAIDFRQVHRARIFGLSSADRYTIPLIVELSSPSTIQISTLPLDLPSPQSSLTPLQIPTSTPTPNVTILSGNVSMAHPDQVVISASGGMVEVGEYTVTISEATEIEKANPDQPIQVGEQVMITGLVDTHTRIVAATQIIVNAVRLSGIVSEIATNAEGILFTVHNPSTCTSNTVELRHKPTIDYGLEFHHTIIPDIYSIPWKEIDSVEIFGLLGTDGIVTPTRISFLSRVYLIPPFQ